MLGLGLGLGYDIVWCGMILYGVVRMILYGVV